MSPWKRRRIEELNRKYQERLQALKREHEAAVRKVLESKPRDF
jgi:hypothetical protein